MTEQTDDFELVIPADRLPPGFAEDIDRASAAAVEPRPAATAVLLRDGETGPELLLLKRLRSAGFVPGAYVFPGGRVDTADADPQLVGMLGDRAADAMSPAPHYWLGAIREVFEETGVLLASRSDGSMCTDATADPEVGHWRERLLSDGATLLDVMRALDAVPETARMVYCAHWITPRAEPKRYDTRFFLAALPHACEAAADAREMSDAVWLTPEAALEQFRQGELPMVFPTVKTIQRLVGYDSVNALLNTMRGEHVPAVLPRLVRTPDGVGIVVDE